MSTASCNETSAQGTLKPRAWFLTRSIQTVLVAICTVLVVIALIFTLAANVKEHSAIVAPPILASRIASATEQTQREQAALARQAQVIQSAQVAIAVALFGDQHKGFMLLFWLGGLLLLFSLGGARVAQLIGIVLMVSAVLLSY